MHGTPVLYLLCLLAVLLLAGGWWYFHTGPPPEEVILFATIGDRPFEDYIYTGWPDGSHVKRFLNPEANRSFKSASGNSLLGPVVVTVSEVSSSTKPENHLYTYSVTASNRWKRLTTLEGSESNGMLSPDGSQVAFTFMPRVQSKQQPELPRLWLVNVNTGESKKLTENDEEGTWDTTPSWRPDGQEIAFIRNRYTPQGVSTKLMRVPSLGGAVNLFHDGPVVDVCYAPDGKRFAVMAKDGLEIWDIADSTRTVIMSWSSLPEHTYRSGGIAWSRSQDKILFSFLNTRTSEYELWTISSNGSNMKQIYGKKEGRIASVSFTKP